MEKLEKKEYGTPETPLGRLIKAYKYGLPKYDTDILNQNLIITAVKYMRDRMDSHGTISSVWLLTVFLDKKKKPLHIASNHAYVREIISHLSANPNTPLSCRIIAQGEAQAKRYRLAEPIEEENEEEN